MDGEINHLCVLFFTNREILGIGSKGKQTGV